MIAHSTEELRDAVLPCCRSLGGHAVTMQRDTTLTASTEERCFRFLPLRGSISRPTELSSVEIDSVLQ